MALSDILAAMEAEADAEVRRVADQEAGSVAEMRAATERDVAEIRARKRREVELPLRRERARRLNRALLAAQRAASRAREDLFQQALAEARSRLGQLRVGANYAYILRALASEALAQAGPDAVLRADPRDEQLIREMFPGRAVRFDLPTPGGVEAHAAGGRIVVVNTLEARLEKAESRLRQAIMPMLDG